VVCLKCAWSTAVTPLPIVCPTDHAVPPNRWDIFIDDGESAVAQHAAYFIQNEACVLCVMENVTEQDGVKALISNRKMAAIIGKVIDASGGAVADVQPDHPCAEHALQMMRDEAITAADVEHSRPRRQYAGYFERHVICSTNFTAASHALEATFDSGGQAGH